MWLPGGRAQGPTSAAASTRDARMRSGSVGSILMLNRINYEKLQKTRRLPVRWRLW